MKKEERNQNKTAVVFIMKCFFISKKQKHKSNALKYTGKKKGDESVYM